MADILIRDAMVKKSRTQRAAQAGQATAAEIDQIIAQRLAKGKEEVARYLDLILVAEETAQVARKNDRYSSNRSAPGSLETWEARAIRFQKAAGHYRIKLDEALTMVRTLEPSFRIQKR